VTSKRLSADTRGVPYHMQIKQFMSAYIYGNPENCSVDRFLMILLYVGLRVSTIKKKKKKNASQGTNYNNLRGQGIPRTKEELT
jgi:hypothetical protein